MKIKKWIASLLAVCALAAVFSGCSNPSSTPSGSSSSTSSEGQSGTAEDENVIRVATAGSYPMFTQLKEDGETLEGIDIEVWEEIGRRTGKEIVFVVENLDAAFGDIDAGRVDSADQHHPHQTGKIQLLRTLLFQPLSDGCSGVKQRNHQV